MIMIMIMIIYNKKILSNSFIANFNQLYSTAFKILNNAEQTEDVMQTVYIKIIEAAEISNIRQPVNYLSRMVRNTAIDYKRRLKLEHSIFAVEIDNSNLWETSIQTETIVIHRQLLLRIALILATLPKRQQQVFELYVADGLTQQAIADKLNVSVSLVSKDSHDTVNQCQRAVLAN